MAIPFSQVPSTLRVPLFWAELDNSAAAGGADKPKTLLLGQQTAAGSAAADTPVLVPNAIQAAGLFGEGSQVHRMALRYFENDPFGEVWAIPQDDAAGTQATANITVAGPATSAGTVFLYVGGVRIDVPVADEDTAAEIVTAIVARFADDDIAAVVSCTAADGAGDTVDITALNDGTLGDAIDVRTNYLGVAGGEAYPDGVTVTDGVTDLEVAAITLGDDTGGATDPTLTAAIAAMGDVEYDYIVSAYNMTAELDRLETELADRWDAMRQVYGHCFAALRGTQGTLSTAGNLRNDAHVSIFGFDEAPTTPEEVAAAFAGACARSLKIDAARPLQTLPLLGVKPTPRVDAFTATEQDSLLFDGVACGYVAGGKLRITRAITTYQKDAFDNPDASYLDLNTLATLQYVLRFLKSRIESRYPRHKLVNDGTNFGAGQAVVSPSTIRAELVAGYLELEKLALVEDVDAFVENLIVERDDGDPNRVNVLYPPDLANQLRIVATLVQFRLQYPATAE